MSAGEWYPQHPFGYGGDQEALDKVAQLQAENKALHDEVAGIPNALWPKWTGELQQEVARLQGEVERLTGPFPDARSNWTKDQWRQLALLARHRAEKAEGEVERLTAELQAYQDAPINSERKALSNGKP